MSDLSNSTPDGIVRAEELALHLMNHVIASVETARLDTATTSLFLLAEILAGLEVFAGLTQPEALERIAAMTAERIDSLRCIVEEQADEETAPRLPSACGGLRVLH